MKRINYKSDFDFILRMKDCKDKDKTVPFPECDFDALFWTSSKAKAYAASYRDGIYTNCFRTEDGGMHFVFNDHRMGMGTLRWEPHFELPNDIYPDGIQDLFRKAALGIELVDGDGDCPTTAEIEVLLPYIKGDAFTYEDFTPEQIADLKRPATEAAERLDSFVQTASEAETIRVGNEELRVNAEATRVSQEESRVGAEETRVTDETKRREAETERSEAEEARKTAETERAAEFATWKSEIDSKADAENVYTKTQVNTMLQSTDERLNDTILDVNNLTANKQDVLSTTADLHITDDNILGLTELAKMRLFIDQWNAACGSFGRYNPETGYFELNGLTNITYEEAVRIYSLYFEPLTRLDEPHHSFQLTYGVRTLIPYNNIGFPSYLTSNYFDSTGFEVIRMSKQRDIGFMSPSISGLFNRNGNIRAWLDVVQWFGNTTFNNNKATFSFLTFDWYPNHPFKYFRFRNVNFNVHCRYYPNIGIDSFQYLVNHRFLLTTQGANPFTVTVHPDVYAKLTGDTTNAAAAELTEEELAQWQQLLADAAEKQITFATI